MRSHRSIAYSSLLLLLVLSALAAAVAFAEPPSMKTLVDDGAALLDVRSEEEFRHAHIDGAINIPLLDLPYFLEELGPKHRAIVVYCQSGGRSAEAAKFLRQVGYVKVFDL